MDFKKQWKVYLIHHSHTDIGYTERQDKIINYHCDFIKQAIDILNDIHENHREEYQGFVWQCENYWQVKNFYAHAPETYLRDFEKYVHSGEIGISGNYLNMTELISKEVLDTRIAQAQEYGCSIGHPVVSGMTADINGFAWGYVDSLAGHGIKHLYSCLHPHHGMFPLYRKVMPFYWESPQGNKVLVWNGEHYHFGNEMFLSPHAGSSYMTYDEFHKPLGSNSVLIHSAEDTDEKEMEIARTRIERYLANLEEEGYPYGLVPFMVSGAITDNAPPNINIAKRVNELNRIYQGRIEFRMVTLEQFFHEVETNCKDIDTYKGDWNDWWADGVGSTPAAVKIFCDARRKYNICRKLDGQRTLGEEELMDQAAENLMLYAEHTWGYSSSVSEPWETLVGDLEMKKTAYAINANTEVSRNLDGILAKKGEVTIAQDRPHKYKIINPHDMDLKTKVYLYIEFWEYIEGISYGEDMPVEVVDLATREVLQSQVKRIARATQVEVLVDLKSGEEKEVMIRLAKGVKPAVVKNHAHIGAEGVEDVIQPEGYRTDTDCVETDYYQVILDQQRGIAAIIDKRDGQNLIREDAVYPAFTGIYEVTDMQGQACESRRRMGRNRKDVSTARYASALKDIRIVENGPVYTAVQLDYRLHGTGFYSVFLKVYKAAARLEAMVRIHKDSVWEPENLYISLPFTAGEEEVKYIDKTGCIIRPGIDQLPGTNMEFYLLQNGIVMEGREKTLTLAIKDAPLVTFGNLEAHPIRLCDGRDEEKNRGEAYSWVMNNFWETNFKVDLGGFYEFAYTLSTHEKCPVEKAMEICAADNEGVLGFYAG
ncbi:MAG: hypothetical protein K2O13_11925 [Lachnospiraceae bacterium]|nr:hypothetical protein [Lachnospiraceae bacterium]